MNYIRQKIIVLGIISFSLGLVSCNQTAKSKDKSNNPVVLQPNENSGVYDGIFSIPDVEIVPSPDEACEYTFPKEVQIVDYSVSPTGSLIAVLIEENGQHSLNFWQIETSELLDGCDMPKNFNAETIVWHPQAHSLFVLGTQNTESIVYRVENTNNDWVFKQIFSSSQKLKNMVVCPQPFIMTANKIR